MKDYLTFILIVQLFSINHAQKNMYKTLNVAVFVYEGVEILDFGGPAEVFASSVLKDKDGKTRSAFNVYIVAATKDEIKSQGFIKLTPNYSIDDCPNPDIIILPGGSISASRKNPKVIEWIQKNAKQTDTMLSVCTGAFLLGDAKLLEGKKATTWYGAIDQFQNEFPNTDVLKNVRFVDNGSVITTAGVSAGIDGALHLVKKLLGLDAAIKTARYMEYDKWDKDAGYILKN